MRFLVSCGMEAAPGESFNTSERVVGDSFRCFASSLRLIARPAESSFRPVPGLLWSGTVGVSHKSARDARKNDLVRDFTEKLLDKRPACRLFCKIDRKSTRLNSSHLVISYAVFCLKKKKNRNKNHTVVDRKNINYMIPRIQKYT